MNRIKAKPMRLLIAFVLFSILWTFIVPPLQTPDEQAHLRYTQFIVEQHRIPNSSDIKDKDLIEDSESIESFIEETQADRIFHNRSYHFDFWSKDKTDIDGINASHLFNHPPLYYIWGSVIYTLFSDLGLKGIMYSIRISNILFSLVIFIYSYRSALILFRNKWVQYFLVAAVNLWPMFMFIKAGINNDILVVCAFTATVYSLLKFIKAKNLNKMDYLVLSFWVFVGCLSKAQYITIIPIVVLVVFLHLKKSFDFRNILAFIIPIIPVIVYFVWNYMEFGGVFPNPAGKPGIVQDNFFISEGGCWGLSLSHYFRLLFYSRLYSVFMGFVGNFGWLDTLLPKYIYMFFFVFMIVSVMGYVINVVLDLKSKTSKKEDLLLLSVAISLELFYVFLFLRTYLRSCYDSFPTQGRYYFPLILPLFLIVCLGLKRLLPKKVFILLCKTGIVAILFFNVFCISVLLQRYYL